MLPERTPENLSAQNASCKGASSSSQAIRERRRAQNRISQQCLREKKRLARSDGLQSLDKITEEPTSSGSECNINLTGDAKRHSDLIKDNQELRIALLGMRKKLLSLSTSATTAANDPIFDRILGLHHGKRKCREHQAENADLRKRSSPNLQSKRQEKKAGLEVPETFYENERLSPAPQASATAVSGCNSSSLNLGQQGLGLSPFLMVPSLSPTSSVNWGQKMCEILCHIIPAQSLRRMEESGHIRILSPAGPETTANGLNIALESRDLFKSTGAKTSSERKIADVTAMAVELLAKQSGLEEYIYGIGLNGMMESILKWRLSPTLANRIAILEPHQPTQLQHSTSNYPLSIDLVCWPSIRDQLIFLLGNQAIDLEEILEDLFVSTVIEQPELGASANPYDIFLTHILPAIRSEEKSHEIEDDGTRENTPPINMSGIPNRTRPSIRIQQLALQYGLYSKHAWKIDIWFQDKYPFIDCSLILSTYPLVAATLLSTTS